MPANTKYPRHKISGRTDSTNPSLVNIELNDANRRIHYNSTSTTAVHILTVAWVIQPCHLVFEYPQV